MRDDDDGAMWALDLTDLSDADRAQIDAARAALAKRLAALRRPVSAAAAADMLDDMAAAARRLLEARRPHIDAAMRRARAEAVATAAERLAGALGALDRWDADLLDGPRNPGLAARLGEAARLAAARADYVAGRLAPPPGRPLAEGAEDAFLAALAASWAQHVGAPSASRGAAFHLAAGAVAEALGMVRPSPDRLARLLNP